MNMHDSPYMQSKSAHIQESLSNELFASESRRSSASPASCAYGTHDMAASYTSMAPYSPYSMPAYDSSLPTPVSIVGSPPMPERSEKMMSTYDQHGGGAQQLTPPTTSRPWPYTPSMTSASPAPMPVPTSAAGMLDAHTMEASHSPEQHHAVADSTPHFHWSTYGVSNDDAAEELPAPLPPHSMHPGVQSSLMIESPPYGLSAGPHVQLAPGLSHASIHPHPSDIRPLMGNSLHDQYDNLSNISLEYVQTYPSRRSAKARASRSSRLPKRGRAAHQTSTKNSMNYGGVHAVGMGPNKQPDAQNPTSDGAPKYLTLDAKAPEDSRYLVEVRCKMGDDKGKGMWEHIQQAYKERYGHKTKENLQMQLIRSVQSYAIWPKEEDEALKAAVKEYERRRYPEIRKIMKEKGGRRVWDWNDGSIAKRLVQMGVDEIDHQDPVKRTRRKRKSTVIPKSGGEPWVGCSNIPFNEPRELTREENDLLLEAYCKTEPQPSEQSHTDGAAEYPPASSAACNGGLNENQSARVAKQACDQYFASQSDQLYCGPNENTRYMS
ncbi:hypothetical protein F4861DRAFT_432915 [Xylaria intraflava]|nr:hypothetical protein F4861DRAFT_432915 [Xylaria intraflava]